MHLCIRQSSDECQTHGTTASRNTVQPLQARDDHLITNETAEPQSKNDDSRLHNQKLIMENHSLKIQVEKLLQQVKDLQLHVSNVNATKKKHVRFSDDIVSPVQLLRDGLPSMSASDLAELGHDLLELGSDIFRELGKRLPSDQTSSTTATGDVHRSPQTTSNVHMAKTASPTSSHTPKTPSPVHDNDQPRTKPTTSDYMKGTTAADARSRSRSDSTLDGLMKQRGTRTPTRPATPKTFGRSALGMREQPHKVDRKISAPRAVRDISPTPCSIAAAASSKGRPISETG